MTEDTVHISPTILYRVGRCTLEAVTVNARDGHTMLVFRSEEAEKFRSHTGLYSEADGFKPLALDHEQLAAFLWAHECTHGGRRGPLRGGRLYRDARGERVGVVP